MARSYIVLVNWNGHADTIECLESLLRLDDADFCVVVVDNGSSDGSVGHIRSWAPSASSEVRSGPIWDDLPRSRRYEASLQVLPLQELETAERSGARIILIEAGDNLGFASANNVALRFASRDPAAEYFWILNNDTVAKSSSLSALVAHAEANPADAMIGATLLYYHEPKMVQGLGGWLDSRRALSGHVGFGLPVSELPSLHEIKKRLAYVMGASIFIRRDVYTTVGGMSEDYFLYYEELDWARRLPPSFKLSTCLSAVVYHKEGGSIGTDSLSRPSDTSLYYSYASALRFYWKHERRYMPMAAARILYNLVAFARKRDLAAIRITFRAFADAATRRSRRGAYGSKEFLGIDRGSI